MARRSNSGRSAEGVAARLIAKYGKDRAWSVASNRYDDAKTDTTASLYEAVISIIASARDISVPEQKETFSLKKWYSWG